MLPTVIPAAQEGYSTILRGRASWYGKYFQGMKTTSGERFNRFKYTCAHKTLPFGTRLRVTNLSTGATVVVRVSDRGPFRHERIIDLAEVAARPLGLIEAGAATVVAEVVPATTPLGLAETPDNLADLKEADPNPQAPFTAYLLPAIPAEAATDAVAATATPASALAPMALAGPLDTAATSHFVVQAGTFADVLTAQAQLARILTLDQALPAEVVNVTVAGRPLNRVVVGQLDSWLAAETVRRNLQLWGIAGLVCQLPTEQGALGAHKMAAPPVGSVPLALAAAQE
ncbi:septal ring lytic transglycosylase RlpA family protein [Hymenobacter sp. H14-R3]|uniref:septal ring lytic transglycosylase RlpA family protein n=1 Tax=Hymenobacter sp. H14-R3 TaxID=3046308 RepID=UPI0024B910B5|nr:septal ring lytic transglycosylase RlpA family protein [Hymenobacter sp. H14-R3]MDJ0364320.1 septal ring lytic transglycosylase RlpA family protein [Hymenobacter sp. H14-R3]